jgi:two-component system nitrogen regulation sensor histidine kinase NtrY
MDRSDLPDIQDNDQPPKERGMTVRTLLTPPVLIVGGLLLLVLLLTGIEFQHASRPSGSQLLVRVVVIFLFNIDVVLSVLLLFVLLRNIVKIYWNRKRSGFGSGFQARLIGSFLLMVLIPSLLLFVVASGFLTNSVQRWFSFPVSDSLEASASVSREYYRQVRRDMARTAAGLIDSLKNQGETMDSRETLQKFLDRKKEELKLAGIEVYRFEDANRSPSDGGGGNLPVLWARKVDLNVRLLDSPVSDLSGADARGPMSKVYATGVGDLVRAFLPFTLEEGDQGKTVRGMMVVDTFVPGAFSRKLKDLTHAFSDYQEIRQFRNPIRQSYLLVFFMITIMIIFGAVWFGLYLARRITKPLLALEKATEEVAKGNLSVRIPLTGEEEFGVLVESFNQMTSDLALSNETLTNTNLELSHRREYMEKVLEHIGTGVFSLNRNKIVTTFNRSAEEILGIPRSFVLGRPMGEVLHPAFHVFDIWVDRILQSSNLHVEEEVVVNADPPQTLRIRYNRFEDPDAGAVVVFDDVTTLVNAQKALAWREVAQRIAHEIKNPLTPIQLAAERLKRKFAEKAPDFSRVFDESIKTIVSEVQGIKHLVDEFSTFARLPESRPVLSSIEPVLLESVVLYRSAHREVDFVLDIARNLPDLWIDPQAFRRVFSNLFENAIIAMKEKGRIWVHVVPGTPQERLHIVIEDNGPGILPEAVEKIFMPYFSTRDAGMGLGLAIVQRIVSEHRGSISYAARQPSGSRFTIELPVPDLTIPREVPVAEEK